MGMTHLIIGVSIFLVSYVAIVSEKMNRTLVALLGGGLMVVFHVLTQDEAFSKIDFNTLGLLIGMMIIVNVIKHTGLFQYLAIKSAKLAKGNPFRILLYFSILTALASAFLDNVTTILMIIPVTLVIADALNLNPIPFIVSEIISSNIGGAATLIGDPPNIMIGGEIGFEFDDFILNLMPLMIIVFIVVTLIIRFIYRNDLKTDDKHMKNVLAFDEHKVITDPIMVKKSMIVLFFTIVGFTISEPIGVPSATIAMVGASILLVIGRVEPEEVLEKVEWSTIFFFIGLFILVGSLESIGVIDFLANGIVKLTGGNVPVLTFVILWMSAILSSILDNIPYVATMIPLVTHVSNGDVATYESVWWALSIGACLGGTGTIVGASANVVARGIVEKQGFKITFIGYMKIAYPLMLLSILISSIYIFIFYI